MKPSNPAGSFLAFIAKSFVWILTAVATLVGILLLCVASSMAESGVWHHIIRDVGIAFVVAAIVSGIYELHARTLLDLERASGVLDATMRTLVPPELWDELRSDVIQRDVIRRNAYVRLKVTRQADACEGHATIWMQLGYALQGLKVGIRPTVLEHELDYHLEDRGLGLPRFERLEVGTRVYEGPTLEELVKDGVLRLPVDVTPDQRQQIISERSECAYIPGSYSVFMAEITDGITIHVDELPDDIVADVKIRTHRDRLVPRSTGRVWFFEGILLPGQGFEIKFTRRPSTQGSGAPLAGSGR